MLEVNTNWDLVERLHVYDDGSEDGTAEWLQEACENLGFGVQDGGIEVQFRQTNHGGPVGVMLDYLSRSTCDVFAKIDNDIVVPPGWLEALLATWEANEGIELLGMEAGRIATPEGDVPLVHEIEPCSHIGGVGLMSRLAFTTRPPMGNGGRFGFTEWQQTYEPVRGWINPDLLVSSLDQVPVQPWVDLSDFYVDEGWQRKWPRYHSVHTRAYWGWWAKEEDIVPTEEES